MKMIATILLAFCLQVSAKSLSQTITLSAKKISLKEIFTQVEKQTGFYVVYNQQMIDPNKQLSVNVINEPLKSFLHLILKDEGLDFIIENKTVILKKGATTSIAGNSVARIIEQQQQPPPITGVVRNSDGVPLEGASIKVKGLQVGTTTDGQGRFVIDADVGQVLEISFIGYETTEIIVTDLKPLTVTLNLEESSLEQLVVVGYGTQKKKDLTGSVSSVKGETIAERNVPQIAQALQGAIPGLLVLRSNGAPGYSAALRIRGITTIGDNSPLILVDGVPVTGIDNIHPNDVEDITVLKDAASASIYGARAAAGVILITTKRAKPDQLSLDFTYNWGIEKPTEMPDFAGVKRYMRMVNELRWNDIGNIEGNEYPVYTKDIIDNYDSLHAANPDVYPNTDWMGLLIKDKAKRERYLLNISAGSQAIQSKISLSYDNTDGLYIGKSFERFTARINNNINILKRLRSFIDIRASRAVAKDPSESPMTNAYRAAPVYAAIWSNGLVAEGKSGNNMYAQLLLGGYSRLDDNQIGGRAGLEFLPVKGLKLSAIISPEFNFNKEKNFRKKVQYTNYDDPSVYVGTTDWGNTTNLTESRYDFYNITTQFLADYKRSFGSHNISLLGGYESYYLFRETVTAYSGDMTLDNYPYLNLGNPNVLQNSGNAYENAYRSYLGRLNYDFRNTYLFQANIRFDASSRFHKDYRWAAFPSFSVGWVASNEKFMENIKPHLSFLKLRGSWGVLGNERIGNYPYQSVINFSNALLYQGTDIVSAQTAAQYSYAIKDISWETTTSYNLGIDLGFLNNKLNLTGDYYKKTTRDMLLALEIPDYMGFSNPDQNTGKMYTKGWEIAAEWRDKIGDLRYAVTANFSDFKSVLGDLGGIQFLGDKVRFMGSEFDEWFGYKSLGIYQTNEDAANSPKLFSGLKAGDLKYQDISGPNGVPDSIISQYDKVLLGGSLPRYMYGGNINLWYKNFDLGIAFQGVGKVLSQLTSNMVQPYLGSWGNMPMEIEGKYWSVYNTAEQNLAARYPRLSSSFANNNYAFSDFWLFNGAYFRLKNLVLGYTIPASATSKFFVKSCRVYGSISDVLSINKYPKGWDPEVANTGYPITTSYNLGITVKF